MRYQSQKSLNRWVLACALCSSFAVLIQAQTLPETLSTNQKLSLAQAKEVAFERNWDLLAAKSGIDSATAQLIVVKEYPNPTFSWSTARIGARENATDLGNGIAERNYDTILPPSINSLR